MLKNKRTPGNDGLTAGLYKCHWKLLEPYFMACLDESITQGELSHSQKQGIVRLIEKKDKDRREIENWRPISLLNIDTKIFSKILANRIKNVLPEIISEEQTGFIKQRFIGEGIQMINGVLDYCKENNEQGLMIAIDFKKAFDSVNHKFLFKALEQFGFGENFIHMVRTLHCNAENAVLNNGFTTKYFKLERSCRQGDCLSPYLFILALELLCIRIKNCSEIKGIVCWGKEMKYSAYADDLTVFIKNKESY